MGVAAFEALSILALLRFQGVPAHPKGFVVEICRRLRARLGAPSYSAQAFATCGSASLLLGGLGVGSGFICVSLDYMGTPRELLSRVLAVHIMPGFVEELIFRGMLLPLPKRDVRDAREVLVTSPLDEIAKPIEKREAIAPAYEEMGAKKAPTATKEWTAHETAALVVFLAYHLDAIHSSPRAVFTDLRFLALAAVVGAACTNALLCTGSLWPSMVMHGTWVWLWLSFGRCS
eukprot:CAMPEP_0117500428 /NCGR_PEP_ID=MMETSP0784-20121206/22771_1 /TAXON_ID=39447 /ORGANISM="" /LENGTH=231 /DNA_ID=CAMNT_0005295637 /DNA_START=137 /DNA_END=833 /DNA_ORIENTATION=-